MSRKVKLKGNDYLDSSSVVYRKNTLENWLSNIAYRRQIVVCKLNELATYGYKAVSITIPAHTVYIVTGIHTGQVADSNGLQVTNIYNGLYPNDSDNPITYTYYCNYYRPGSVSQEQGSLTLDILAIQI